MSAFDCDAIRKIVSTAIRRCASLSLQPNARSYTGLARREHERDGAGDPILVDVALKQAIDAGQAIGGKSIHRRRRRRALNRGYRAEPENEQDRNGFEMQHARHSDSEVDVLQGSGEPEAI